MWLWRHRGLAGYTPSWFCALTSSVTVIRCLALVSVLEVESCWSRIHDKTSARRVLKHCWLCYSSFLCDSAEDLDSGFRVVEVSQGALLPYLHIHCSALLQILYISTGSGANQTTRVKGRKDPPGRIISQMRLSPPFTSLPLAVAVAV